MMFRNLVAGAWTICFVAVALPPIEASARSSGLTTGRGPMVRAAVLRGGLRSSFLTRRGPALVAKNAVFRHVQSAHAVSVRRFHRVFGARFPRNGIGVYDGSISNPDDFLGTAPQTVSSTPVLPEDGEVLIGRRCGSQSVVVPSEAGGERRITVTYCGSE
jgi:hypothetical protein